MEIQAGRIIEVMNQWAPPELAESWDHPGLQIGSAKKKVRKVLVALDVTAENAAYAAEHGVDMIISHHPFLFRALQQIDTDTEKGRTAALLCAGDICVFAAHTNLDSADGGVNDVLADRLELHNRRGLIPVCSRELCKLAVYAPEESAETIRHALDASGAGAAGQYSGCSFSMKGEGRFTPQEGAHPFIGAVRRPETVREVKIETILPESLVSKAVEAMLRVHPYEEPAYDIYRLKNQGRRWSMGRIGEWEKPLPGPQALAYVRSRLGLSVLRCSGCTDRMVSTVAVLGGAGAEFAEAARKAGADLYVTGDVKYHEAQEAASSGLLLADGGHFGTEKWIIPAMAARLSKEGEKRGWDVRFEEDPTAADIFQYI
jgi:dinuclear metal center YbgI/SA1388 family protein